jgi:Transposase DDE domain group 1
LPRSSTDPISPNRCRPIGNVRDARLLVLWFASMAYVLVDGTRRLALQATDLADATCGTIRRKLFKIGALVTISVRRVKFAMASGCPYKAVFATAHRALDTT